MNEPHGASDADVRGEETLTDDEIQTRPFGSAASPSLDDDTDTGDVADSGDDSGDDSDTGDDSGDDSDTGDDSGDDSGDSDS